MLKNTFTLIVGEASTDDHCMHFERIDTIRSYTSLHEALAAGEAALRNGADAWCIPEVYTGALTFTAR